MFRFVCRSLRSTGGWSVDQHQAHCCYISDAETRFTIPHQHASPPHTLLRHTNIVHPIKTPYQLTLSTHTIDTRSYSPYQQTLSHTHTLHHTSSLTPPPSQSNPQPPRDVTTYPPTHPPTHPPTTTLQGTWSNGE